MTELAALYLHRFPETELLKKRQIWEVLCRVFFQKYVAEDGVVLDLACGYGEFINHIRARTKHCVDLNPDAARFLAPDIQFHPDPADHLDSIANDSIDTVFTSNFFEHLPDKRTLSAVMLEVRRVLRPKGKFLILGPNILYLPGAYWDFYDHLLPLTHNAVAEGLTINNFDVELIIDRFLPYSTKSRLPQHPALVSMYLKMPVVWRVLGKQFFIVARKA